MSARAFLEGSGTFATRASPIDGAGDSSRLMLPTGHPR